MSVSTVPASRGVARRVVAVVVALVPVAAILAAGAALAPRLGSTMASHWSTGPTPDQVTATWPLFWGLTAVTVALSLAGAVLAVVGPRVAQARVWAGLAVMVAGEVATAWIATAWATVAADSPEQARLDWRMGLLVLGLACGAAVYLLLPAVRPTPSGAPQPAPVPLRDGDRLAWTGTIRSRLLLVLAVALAAVFVVLLVAATRSGSASAVALAVVGGLATLAVLGLSWTRLTVDHRGVRLTSAVLGVPVVRVGWRQIEAVTAEEIDPVQWGGWGLRVSSAGLAYVTRRGPGLVVARHGGRALALTVDRPEQAAAVAEALLVRHA